MQEILIQVTISCLLTDSETMSNKLERLFRLFMLLCLMKYFCAWLATCVGVLVCTKFREMPLQSPFPSFCNPTRNKRCSSSVHGTPALAQHTALDSFHVIVMRRTIDNQRIITSMGCICLSETSTDKIRQ